MLNHIKGFINLWKSRTSTIFYSGVRTVEKFAYLRQIIFIIIMDRFELKEYEEFWLKENRRYLTQDIRDLDRTVATYLYYDLMCNIITRRQLYGDMVPKPRVILRKLIDRFTWLKENCRAKEQCQLVINRARKMIELLETT